MFNLAQSKDDVMAYINKVWNEQINITVGRPPTNFRCPLPYPILLSSAVSSSQHSDSYSFVHIICGRKDAKTLVYPKTNMLNKLGSAGFVRIEDRGSAKRVLDSLKNSADMSFALQRTLINEAERFIDTNGYPVLYARKAYGYKNSIIEQPFILSVDQAKKLVYANKNKKKKRVTSPRQFLHRHALAKLSDSATLVREDNGDFSILVELSYITLDIVRFTYEVEEEILRKERIKLETVRIELTRSARQARPGSDLVMLAKGILERFSNWRKILRSAYTSRMPDEVLVTPRYDPTHYSDLGYITDIPLFGTNIREE